VHSSTALISQAGFYTKEDGEIRRSGPLVHAIAKAHLQCGSKVSNPDDEKWKFLKNFVVTTQVDDHGRPLSHSTSSAFFNKQGGNRPPKTSVIYE
jgi:hypothetical protein